MADVCAGRIKNVFERICVLIFFHQFEVDEPLSFGAGLGMAKPCFARFEQRGGEFVFAVGRHFFCRGDQPFFREAEVVDEKFCAVGITEMIEAFEVPLPIVDSLRPCFASSGVIMLRTAQSRV